MLTANKLLLQGQGLSAVILKRSASVELDWDVRQKSRFAATDSQGRELAVFCHAARPCAAAMSWWPKTAA